MHCMTKSRTLSCEVSTFYIYIYIYIFALFQSIVEMILPKYSITSYSQSDSFLAQIGGLIHLFLKTSQVTQFNFATMIIYLYRSMVQSNPSPEWDHSHSWFFKFDKKYRSQIPSWFLRWWTMHGSILKRFSKALLGQMRYFSSEYQVNQHNAQFPTLLHFNSIYKVNLPGK